MTDPAQPRLSWGGVLTERRVKRNPQVPGTPRHEKGFRPFVDTLGPDACAARSFARVYQRRVYEGPLFPDRAAAEAWLPPAPYDLDELLLRDFEDGRLLPLLTSPP
jgi:hypothetical protein